MKPRYDIALDFNRDEQRVDSHLSQQRTAQDTYICYAGHVHDIDDLAEIFDVLEMNGIPPIAWSK